MNKELTKVIIEQCAKDVDKKIKVISVEEYIFTIEYDNEKYTIPYDQDYFNFEEYTLDEVREFIKEDIKKAIDIKDDSINQIKQELRNTINNINDSYNEYKKNLRDENDEVVISVNLTNIKKDLKDKTGKIYKEKTLESAFEDLVNLSGKVYNIVEEFADEGNKVFDNVKQKYNSCCQEEPDCCKGDNNYCEAEEDDSISCCEEEQTCACCDINDDLIVIDDVVSKVLDDMGISECIYDIEIYDLGIKELPKKNVEVQFIEFADKKSKYLKNKPSFTFLFKFPQDENNRINIANNCYKSFKQINTDDIKEYTFDYDETSIPEQIYIVSEIKKFINNITLPEYAK
jgi:hypothetical protein